MTENRPCKGQMKDCIDILKYYVCRWLKLIYLRFANYDRSTLDEVERMPFGMPLTMGCLFGKCEESKLETERWYKTH